MTRHARNSTAGAVYTYHERQKDTKQSGYGSKDERLGKDSVKDFDCCCLTLQPCRDPMITAEGYLFDKEAILKYILHQKRLITRKLKEFSKQKTKEQSELLELSRAEKESQVAKFMAKEEGIISKPLNAFAQPSTSNGAVGGAATSVSNMQADKAKQLPSFWLPCLTPKADQALLKKPDEKVRCPMSGKVLKMKDLLPIKFTPIKDRDEKKALIVKDARYVCAVTNDVLGNSVPCAVLKTSGSVVTMECVEKIIKKDMVDPINSKTLTEKDIIPLQRGATGFSGSGVSLKAKKHGPALMS